MKTITKFCQRWGIMPTNGICIMRNKMSTNGIGESVVWRPLAWLDRTQGPIVSWSSASDRSPSSPPPDHSPGRGFALVILNTRLTPVLDVIQRSWSLAAMRVAVDGAANELFRYTVGPDARLGPVDEYVPDVVCGDFDSLADQVKHYYTSKGSEVIHTPDQSRTDFTKSLAVIGQKLRTAKLSPDGHLSGERNATECPPPKDGQPMECAASSGLQRDRMCSINGERRAPCGDAAHVAAVVALCASEASHRVDHLFANVNTLFLAAKFLPPQVPVVLVSERSLSMLLAPHVTHRITRQVEPTEWCGLLPIGRPATCVTTTGLEWNLTNEGMEFGGLVSTSNRFSPAEVVTVTSDAPLLWTQGYDHTVALS